MEEYSSFKFIAKPVLHSWEAMPIGNTTYINREAINQLNGKYFKLELNKLNNCDLPCTVDFCFPHRSSNAS
jgi:hypothetical protein